MGELTCVKKSKSMFGRIKVCKANTKFGILKNNSNKLLNKEFNTEIISSRKQNKLLTNLIGL